MAGYDKIDALYDSLKKDGVVTKDRDNFRAKMLAPGKEGYENRKSLFNTLKQDGAVTSKSYEEFGQKLGLHAVHPAKPQSSQAAAPATSTPVQKPTAPQAAKPKGTPMTDAYRNAAIGSVGDMVGQTNEDLRRTANQREYGLENTGLKVKPVKLGQNSKVVKKNGTANTYLTQSGNEFDNRAMADLEQNQIDEAYDAQVNPVAHELNEAYAERDRLDRELKRRREELDTDASGFSLRDMPRGSGFNFKTANSSSNNGLWADKEYKALAAANDENKQRITALEAERDKKEAGFWRGFADAANRSTWSFGFSDMMDTAAKLSYGGNGTKGEKAADAAMMENTFNNQQAQGKYGNNRKALYRYGSIAHQAVPFFLEFAATGGVDALTHAGTKLGAKAAEKFATNALQKKLIKYTGTTLGDIGAGLVMANTTGAARTASDIGQRHLGTVDMDKQGNYHFVGGEDWATAIRKGQVAQGLEYYTEKLGAHLEGLPIGKTVAKGLEKIGLSKVAGAFSRAGTSQYAQLGKKVMNRAGINGYFGEVAEEQANIILNAMLVGDNKLSDLFDGRTQSDIWGGMLFSVGAMQAAGQVGGAVGYYATKKMVKNANTVAGYRLTPKKWEPIREQIDNATNEQMGDVVNSIVRNPNMHEQEKRAALKYAEKLIMFRGFNTAQAAEAKEASATGEQDNGTIVRQSMDNAYIQGHEATDEQKNDIKVRHDAAREKMEDIATPEVVQRLDTDPTKTLSEIYQNEQWNEQERAAALEYVNSQAAYKGMVHQAKDNIDDAVNASNATIDSHTHTNDGVIYPATMKIDDRKVYIVGGHVEMNEDGKSVDRSKSSESVMVRDADTGEIDMVAPDAIYNVDSPIDVQAEKDAAAEQIRQTTSQHEADTIDGVLQFNVGDTFAIVDEQGQQHTVQVLGDAIDERTQQPFPSVVTVSIDGETLKMPKEQLQQMSDAESRMRLEQSKAGAEQAATPAAVAEESSATDETKPTYSLDDEVELLDENGNRVQGTIVGEQEDGMYQVETTSPVNGKLVNKYSIDQIKPVAQEEQQQKRYVVNQEAIDKEDIEGYKKSSSRSYVEGYLEEHPETIQEDLNGDIPLAASYLNGEISPYDYLQHLGYATGENSFLDNTDEAELKAYADENAQKKLPYLIDNASEVAPVQTEEVEAGEAAPEQVLPGESVQPTALGRVPKDEQGQPIYEQAEPETAWDAIVEQTEGDEAMAQTVANDMVADMEASVKKAERMKIKGATTVTEKIAAEKERAAAITQAKATLEHWKKIAATQSSRKAAIRAEENRKAQEAALARKEQEEKDRAEREEAERVEREALNGVPDFTEDTPQDGRARGYRRVSGDKVDRQQPLNSVKGKEVQVKFDDKNIPSGHVALIDADELQPSHKNGQRNPRHFIDEAQPKERKDDASVEAARKIASNIRPEEITSSVTAYTGAPTVNSRGEVIQGNSRSAALREMWDNNQEQGEKYKQYLMGHAEEFGLKPEDIAAMKKPVLVNMLDVNDENAITLGQFVASDTESGGTERIKPKNVVKKLGEKMKNFSSIILRTTDEEMSFAQLIDSNGIAALKWVNTQGIITPTQYKSAFDSKGNLTAEAKNDLKGIMYQSIFEGGSTHLEEMFNAMPVKAQKAILATAYRDYDSPRSERMIGEIQKSIMAFYALSHDAQFAAATNHKDARMAAEAWKRQLAMDEVTGESYLPSEKYSNFAMLLAVMYKGDNQSLVQGTFNKMYDLIQGTQEETIFEHPDNTPRALAQAIKETLNIDYDGQQGSNVLAGNSAASQRGEQGSNGDATAGGRSESTNGNEARQRGTETDSGERGRQVDTNALIDKARNGDKEAQQTLGSYGISWNNEHTYRHVGQSEIDALQKDGVKSQRGHDYVDVTSSEKPTTGSDSDYRITFKDNIDMDKDGDRVRMKNSELGNGMLMGGYTMDDVAKIERKNEDGTYTDVTEQLKQESDEERTDRLKAGITNKEEGTAPAERKEGESLFDYAERIAAEDKAKRAQKAEEAKVDTNPTDKQKEAGNYKKGHVKIDGFDISIEQPKGSMRSGKDTSGNAWEQEMHNTYGYIRGTESVDGDHIDIFLSDTPESGNVFVVDQVNKDGSFDEHKVMYGFPDMESAKQAYLSNYEEGWQGLGKITEVNKEEFKKWIDSSHRKTKPFSDYSSVKTEGDIQIDHPIKSNENEFGSAQQTYDSAMKAFSGGAIPNVKSIKTHITTLKKRIKTLENGMATAVNSDAERERAEEAIERISDQLRALQAILNHVNERIKETEQEETKAKEPAKVDDNHKLVSTARYEELKKRMRAKLNNLNLGIDPELISIGAEMAVYHIEGGARKFAEYAKNMITDLGDSIRPYLKAFYNAVRDMPEAADFKKEMTPSNEVDDFNVATIGAQGEEVTPTIFDTAKQISDESTVERNTTKETKQTTKTKNVDDNRVSTNYKDKNGVTIHVGDKVYEDKQGLGTVVKKGGLGSVVVVLDNYKEQGHRGVSPNKLSVVNNVENKPQQETVKKEKNENKPHLRPATAEDVERNPKVFYNGEASHIMTVVHLGEQVGPSQFTKPIIESVYLTNGKNVKLEDVMVEDVDNSTRTEENTSKNSSAEKKKTVSSQQTELFGEQTETTTKPKKSELHRNFSDAVANDMLSALDSGSKPYRSILDLRKRAKSLGMEVDDEGRSDILLQELVEDGLVKAAKKVIEISGRDSRASFDDICKLYEMQPTIAARSSNRIKMQQYSTPLPMSWVADFFAMHGRQDGKVLEPTAGNGMLVFAIPSEQVHVNELDETRLANLREQGYAEVTQQDATEPFEGGRRYDSIIANPPFGKKEAQNYDGKMIAGLDPQITLNALANMKDNGRAAIIIGGNMEYAKNGSIKNMKPFFTYLYDHYNVKGVVDMDGKLYAKQGTTYPTRMILIDGRRSEEERAQTAVYPPVESKAVQRVSTFDELYSAVNDLITNKEKTNGTEILRSKQGQLVSVADKPSGETDGARHREQPAKDDATGRTGNGGTANGTTVTTGGSSVLRGERGEDTGNGETKRTTGGNEQSGARGNSEPAVQRVEDVGASENGVGLTPKEKRTLTEEKLPYRPHNTAYSLNSVAPAAMVEAMDNVLSQIETKYGNIDDFVTKELAYDSVEDAHQALASEQMDSVAMAIYQMKQGHALIIGDQTGVGKGRQMAALIRWAVKQGQKPVFITQKADLFSDIYRDLVDIGSGDLVPFIFNSDGAMVDNNGNVVHKPLSSAQLTKVFEKGEIPDDCDFAILTYSQVNTGDEQSQKEMKAAARSNGTRVKKSKSSRVSPKATFLRAIAKNNYLLFDESHTAAGSSNTGAYLQSLLRDAKAATFASATFAKRPDTMPIYALRTAISKAKVAADKMIGIIEKGGVTLQEIMSRALTQAGQMVRRERDMSDVKTDWKTIDDPKTVQRSRVNYDKTIAAFNAIIKFQEDYVKPKIEELSNWVSGRAGTAGVKKGTNKMGVDNVPFASKTYNYTKQLMLALKVDAIADEVEKEIQAGRHPVIALESTMESTIKAYSVGEVIAEPTFSESLQKGLDSVMQYTITDENGNEHQALFSPQELGEAGERAYNELQTLIKESTSDIFISPLDAIIEKLHEKGLKVGELTGRNMYVERNENGDIVVKRRVDKDKKRMQRDFNNGSLDVLILNKSASTGISLHASEKFSDQRQRSMIIAQPLSDINDYMQMIGRIDRTGQVHRGYYINLGLPVPAENRFLMMLSTKLKSLNANTTTSQDSESNEVEAPDLLNKYGSQVVVEYLRDNPEIYDKMGAPLKGGKGGGTVKSSELDEYKAQEDDARRVTGYAALLSTQEQDEFYNDIVRRYNELIKYLDDTGNNDLKITVMPLRAKTIEKKVSSRGIDPNGNNPFAQNSYVEKIEMDVLRKPMQAEDVKKTIAQINNGKDAQERLDTIFSTIDTETEAKQSAETERYEKAKIKTEADIAKQSEKIKASQKRTEEEKQEAIERYTVDANERLESRHNSNVSRINYGSDVLKRRLRLFEVGKSYLVPDNLESLVFDFAAPAIFCGYKAKDSKITASTTLAVFATLDGRRRVEVKLSQLNALESVSTMTNNNFDAARSTTLENWDSQIPTETRKEGFVMTGNILQAIADTQDEFGSYPGQLISYSDIDGGVHDGILMPDKWEPSMLKSSGAPLVSRLQQIKDFQTVISDDGKVVLAGNIHTNRITLTVPKSKKDGAIFYENPKIIQAVTFFYPYHGKLRADIPLQKIDGVVNELTRLGVKVKDDELMRDDDTLYRIREETPPQKTGIGYKVFVLKNGELYPPMVANPNGDATPVGVWLDADAAPIAGQSKTGRNQVKAGGKGTQGGSGKLAYRPGWHLGLIPYALQFDRKDENGNRTLFPANFVWAEVEYANDKNYQKEAMDYGYNKNGKFQHSYAGLPRVPENGSYRYRTNPNPETDPWIITGAMRVKRLLTPSEVDEKVRQAGRKPQERQTGAVTDAEIKKVNNELASQYRNGSGTLTDDELSTANDPAAKLLGKSTRTANERKEFAERQRQRMTERVNEMASTLHLDNVEVVTDASQLDGKRAKAKGFYSKSSGKITIVIPNNTDVADVEKTLLHEAVAHYGLRKLFGKHFDTFLDNVLLNATPEIRREIATLATKNGWDFRKATEEYLAGLAENTDFERATETSWWQKIKRLFLDMLHGIGFKGFNGVELSDNELRYILWRSYENMKEPGRYRSILGEAEDVAKQYELKVGNYETKAGQPVQVAEDDMLYRAGEPEERERANARDSYEHNVSKDMFQTQEALQDSMLGLKTAMDAVLKAEHKKLHIEDVDDFENPYMGENRLSSTNKAEADAFTHLVFKPMLDEVSKLAKNEAERSDLSDYMMAKHGLERNEVMAEYDYDAYMKNAQEALDKHLQANPNSKATINMFAKKALSDFRKRDYSGLTSLTGESNVASAETAAWQMVGTYEQNHDTKDLWEKTKAVTDATLSKSYESGMISKDTYEKIKDMYSHYIPLRGFDQKTSGEEYAYLSHRESAFNAPIKAAKGRTSKADDPLANMANMAESAIVQGNRNKLVKQRFLNFVLNHPSDLVSVRDLWLKYNEVTDEWNPVFPDNINETDSPEDVEEKMKDFEDKMEALSEQDPGLYKHGKDAVNIPYRVVGSNDLHQHQVLVKRNGREYILTINGNPRAAQALNGQTNPDNDASGSIGAILKVGEIVNRQLSAFYTTRNPDFIVSNFIRDMLYSNSMVWVKESPNYALHFHRNVALCNPVQMKILITKHRKGELDMNNKLERMFHQFMMNGGETGYANVRDTEQHKNDIRRELKRAQGKLSIPKAFSLFSERLDEYNRAVENSARFAAYLTSREMGRTIDRSIYDAKEISVNFNKKGSGAKFMGTTGQTKTGNTSAFVSGLGRSSYVFWNAAIQGTTNFGRQIKRHPAKAFTATATMFLLGALVAGIGMGGDDGDDDDKNSYWNLPEYVRRSNLLFKVGDQWVSIPLPVEYRAIYGMGELMASTMSGKEHLNGKELGREIAGQMTQILPLDFLEGGGGLKTLFPSAVKPFAEVYSNESWTGMPIYKDTPYNKNMPEWTKAYKSANKYIVGLSEILNEGTGGDPYTKGAIDFNPAKVEYILNGYFGGISNTIDKLTKSAETIVGEREYDPRSFLLLNRVMKSGDERTEARAINNEYFRVKDEHDQIKARVKHYEDDTNNGVFDYAKKIDFLYNSKEYRRYEIFEDYRKDIEALYKEINEAESDEERKIIESELTELKKEMIHEMNDTRK